MSGRSPRSRPETSTRTSQTARSPTRPPPPTTTISSTWGIRLYSSFPLDFSPGHLSPSTLRRAQDSLSDPKYAGKRVSRIQLLDGDGQSLPSDSQVEDSESDDEGQVAQERASDTPEPTSRQEHQPDAAQTINQTRQEDRKKGLAVSRQLVRPVYQFSRNHLML